MLSSITLLLPTGPDEGGVNADGVTGLVGRWGFCVGTGLLGYLPARSIRTVWLLCPGNFYPSNCNAFLWPRDGVVARFCD